jgi:hypothetical protein
MVNAQLQVAVHVGAPRHRVAVGDVAGRLLEEFGVEHSAAGLASFFARVEHWQAQWSWPESKRNPYAAVFFVDEAVEPRSLACHRHHRI